MADNVFTVTVDYHDRPSKTFAHIDYHYASSQVSAISVCIRENDGIHSRAVISGNRGVYHDTAADWLAHPIDMQGAWK